MERIKTLFIFILFLENGIVLVQSENILEELLLSVNRMEANMETVMHKVENIEKAIKDTETKVSTIVGDIKTLKYVKYEVDMNSKQNNLILEELETLKEDVKGVKEDQNANHSNVNLHYLNILEEVKHAGAGNSNPNLDQCNEKQSKFSNEIKEH